MKNVTLAMEEKLSIESMEKKLLIGKAVIPTIDRLHLLFERAYAEIEADLAPSAGTKLLNAARALLNENPTIRKSKKTSPDLYHDLIYTAMITEKIEQGEPGAENWLQILRRQLQALKQEFPVLLRDDATSAEVELILNRLPDFYYQKAVKLSPSVLRERLRADE